MAEDATTVKDSGGATGAASSTGAAATPNTGATALSAVTAAFKSTPDSSSGAGITLPQTPPAEGQPPVVVPGQQPPPAPGDGIAQLRSAYDALKAKYARFENLDHDQLHSWWEQRQAFEKDPTGWYRQLGDELTAHPRFSKALQPPPAEEPEPQPDLYTLVDGEKVPVFSAKRQAEWRSWNDKRMESKFSQLVNPLQEYVGQARNESTRRQIMAQSKDTVTNVMKEMATFPGFTEGKAEIAAILKALDPKLKKEIGAIASLHHAYNMWYRDKGHVTVKSGLEKQIREEFAREAGASSGNVRPGGGGGTGQRKSPTNQNELAKALASGQYANAGT